MILSHRNIFPDNLLQACFQHTKTVYIKDTSDDVEDVAEAIISNMTSPNYTLASSTTTTMMTTVNATDNMTYVLLKETEIRYIRDFPMADGINVLGKFTLLLSRNKWRETRPGDNRLSFRTRVFFTFFRKHAAHHILKRFKLSSIQNNLNLVETHLSFQATFSPNG